MRIVAIFAVAFFVTNSGCSLFEHDQLDQVQLQTASIMKGHDDRRQQREERLKKRKAMIEERQKEAEQRKKEWDEQVAREEAESERMIQEYKKNAAKNLPKKRKVRRFKWESPAVARGRVWNVPDEESEKSLLDAFVRVCISEADGVLQDCVGIWQVVNNIRQRNCNRGMVRKITECTDDGQETVLSAFRRAQGHVLGMIKPRNSRVKWISKIDSECGVPKNWPYSDDMWVSRYEKRCQHIVDLGRHLMAGKLPSPRPGVRLEWVPLHPIAWGGRCESGKASCDDHIACARGLSRIKTPGTQNAFWCSPGRGRGCSSEMDPICHQLRQKSINDKREMIKRYKQRGLPQKVIDHAVGDLAREEALMRLEKGSLGDEEISRQGG